MSEIIEHRAADEARPILKFLTCGSVDDGKSTLIGRILYDAQCIMDDQLLNLEADTRRHGTVAGEDLDLALLVDGLQAEREQGITIDVAYRYFATPHRKFIVADTPGHEQYTRNMATGASNSDLAVLLIDARKGVITQTRRHSIIADLMGIRHVVLAINKMDLVNFSQARFDEIAEDYNRFAEGLGFESIVCIPVSALRGDNIAEPSPHMSWHHGGTLLAHLETVDVRRKSQDIGLRMPVQWVCRPDLNFRGYAGTVSVGSVQPGEEICVLPSARTAQVKSIVAYNGELPAASKGDAVVLTLDREIDISRGDVIASAKDRPQATDQFSANLIWMEDSALLPGRPYLIKLGVQTASASVTALKHKVNVDTLEKSAGKELHLNEVGVCNITTSKPLVFDPFRDSRDMGGFILIDRITNRTVGAGMINFGLRRAENVHWQALDVNAQSRADLKNQKAVCLWFTGLSGSGKSTIANLVEKKLHAMGRHTYILDGDNVRHGLNRDLGFTDADRVENIRRVAEVSRLMTDAGLIVLVSFISPFKAERKLARDLFSEDAYLEVFVDTPIELCEQRDPKGLYKKARAGEIKNFTGVDSAYEPPATPELHLPTGEIEPEVAADRIIDALTERSVI